MIKIFGHNVKIQKGSVQIFANISIEKASKIIKYARLEGLVPNHPYEIRIMGV